MSGLFGSKPKIPAAAAVTPTVATPAVQAASDAQRMKARAASGRAAITAACRGGNSWGLSGS